ncbi:hypothetical protein RHECNPAF_470070 [Rhizobium etli CNPAF512]|nr:hypothetical protein RHECNPAF_470070 [Rhizobium etli CNPAF512]
MGDLHALGRLRQIGDRQVADGNVEHLVFAFDEEMMVVGHISVEIGLGALDGENADETGLGELVQRVVDGRQRNRHAGGNRLLMQLLDGQMPVALGKQEIAERDALAGGTQACATQPYLYCDRECTRHQYQLRLFLHKAIMFLQAV